VASTPEKKVKDQVVKILKAHGAYYFFPATGGFGRSGVPDIVCCYKGYFIGIECKAGKNTTTALQDKELSAIQTAGGLANVVNERCIAEVGELLEVIDTMEGLK
jgi:Holliday junction resolvase